MTTYDLSPAFIVIDYASQFAAHKMTLPTRAWTPGGADDSGTYEAWNASTVLASDMVTALLAELVALFDANVHFDLVTIWTKADATAPSVPRVLLPQTGIVGLDGTPGWTEAVQFVFTFFDTAFNTAKLTLLDAASNNNFARRLASTQSADEAALSDVYMNPEWAWASRAGFRPAVVRSLSLGINDKLKATYPGI